MYIHEDRTMQTRIQKWGNSLGLRIPKAFAKEAQISEGSAVDVAVENGSLRIRPLRTQRVSLAALLKGVNRRNLHAEVSTGPSVGREAW
jgi:antitoxin MazE